MKIRGITATPINPKLEAPYVWAFGELDGFSPTIVEVETEDGLARLGEAPSPAVATVIDAVLAPRLIGRDAFDIAGAEHVCLPEGRGWASRCQERGWRACMKTSSSTGPAINI